MKLLGLTGSIGMGKSTTAKLFREAGAPVYDADQAVHDLYTKGGAAVAPIGDLFPDVIVDAAVDRSRLRDAVIGKPDLMKQLETIVHPLVGQSQLAVRAAAEDAGASMLVLDIPLLFETGGQKRCDYVLVVTAPFEIQRERVLSRGEMTEEQFQAILEKQTPDSEKRARADFIISTAFGIDYARDCVDAIVRLMSQLEDQA